MYDDQSQYTLYMYYTLLLLNLRYNELPLHCFCSCATVHDGMNMTDCAAYGTHQPHSSCDLHKPTDEPE